MDDSSESLEPWTGSQNQTSIQKQLQLIFRFDFREFDAEAAHFAVLGADDVVSIA